MKNFNNIFYLFLKIGQIELCGPYYTQDGEYALLNYYGHFTFQKLQNGNAVYFVSH